MFWTAYQSWASGVTVILPAAKSAFELVLSTHCVLQSNYVYGQQSNDPYGIQMLVTADNLVANNIIQQDRSPVVLNGPSTGDVFAYNFTILNQSGSNGNWSFWNHSSGIAYDLWEGNVAAGFANDDIHGSHNMITRFRNYFTGHEDTNTGQLTPTFEAAYNRYSNLIGNVLGTSTFDNTYQETAFNNSTSIYVLGAGNPGSSPSVPDDPLVASTTMRWGNYDTVSAAVRFVSTEVPSGLSLYANPLPSSQALPASFYYAAKPGWWPSSKVWPAIGPDVKSGNIANVGGYANTIPAQDCYLNVMGGSPSGTGSALSFNASTCYGAASGGSSGGSTGGTGSGTSGTTVVNPPTSPASVLH